MKRTSSLFGSEFVNYKREIREDARQKFSHRVLDMNKRAEKGCKCLYLPIVVDSVEEKMIVLLNYKSNKSNKNNKREYVIESNKTIDDLVVLVRNNLNVPVEKTIRFGLENGSIIKDTSILMEKVYLDNYNEVDSILYLLITSETTVYGYVLSLLTYIKRLFLG